MPLPLLAVGLAALAVKGGAAYCLVRRARARRAAEAAAAPESGAGDRARWLKLGILRATRAEAAACLEAGASLRTVADAYRAFGHDVAPADLHREFVGDPLGAPAGPPPAATPAEAEAREAAAHAALMRLGAAVGGWRS